MKLLGIDFETTGLDPEKDLITEVGMVLWDTDRHAPLVVESSYLLWQHLEKLDPEVVEVTGITLEDLHAFGKEPWGVYQQWLNLAIKADAFVAHNGEAFDRKFVNRWAKLVASPVSNLPWIDTQNDVDYPVRITTRKLTHLAAEHGFLNPFAHRAVFDVLTMLRILDQHDVHEALFSAQQPTIKLQALVSYEDRELAKQQGFRWEADTKRWTRTIKRHKMVPYPFQIKELPL